MAIWPSIGGVQAREAVEQGGLAAAGWTHHGHHLAAPDAQIHPAQRRHAHLAGVVNLVHPRCLNNQIIVRIGLRGGLFRGWEVAGVHLCGS